MEIGEKIQKYMNDHLDEMVETLKTLVRIPSVRGDAEEGAPFGRACGEVLEYTEKLYSENGFETELDREGGFLLSYFGSGEKTLGLFAHADVVDVKYDWAHTMPFEPIEKDGFVIGRGVLDDKSAIVISLYAAKALKELDIPFSSRLVMFTGGNEESGMADMDNYLKKHEPPEFSLVCDTAFPMYRGNKCGMNFWVTFNQELRDIVSFGGGTAMNVTLGTACAEVGNEKVTENGISRHSALPEGSVNAGYLLAKRLSERGDICESDRKTMRLVAELLEKHYGEGFGVEHTDRDFGRLTLTNGVIKTEDKKITIGFNMRFGLSADSEAVREKISDFCERNNATVRFEEEKRGYIISENNRYVKACLRAYSALTGDENPTVYLNAGGTYARKLPCAAEIGTTLRGGIVPKGTPDGHGGVHCSDECINIEGFAKAAEMTLAMLLECDGEGALKE